MENEQPFPPQPNPAQPPDAVGEKKAAYDPGWFTFIGLFLTVVPIFLMSHHNSKVFPDGARIWKRMKIYMWIYITLFIANFFVISWATSVMTNYLNSHPELTTKAYFGGVGSHEVMLAKLAITVPEISGAVTIVKNASVSTFCISLFVLILMLRFTNRNELPAFKEMRSSGQINRKNAFIPVVIGILITILMYSGIKYTTPFVANLMPGTGSSQTVEKIEETKPSLPVVPSITTKEGEPFDCGRDLECFAQSFKDCRYTIVNGGTTEAGPTTDGKCYYKDYIGGENEQYCTFEKAEFESFSDFADAKSAPTTTCMPAT